MQENQQTPPDAPGSQPELRVMTGVKKRQQIKDINKKSFLWMAASAVIVSIALVAMQFLIREFIYNQKIINKKSETNKTLVQNIEQAEKLRENINQLIADPKLSQLKYEASSTQTTALSVILDALPVEGDATNFANSLQAKVLPKSGVGIRELSTSASTVDEVTGESAPADSATIPTPLEVPFVAGINGDYQKVQVALSDLSRVIRPISLKKMTIKAVEKAGLEVSIDGVTYYLPARTIEVRKETLKP